MLDVLGRYMLPNLQYLVITVESLVVLSRPILTLDHGRQIGCRMGLAFPFWSVLSFLSSLLPLPLLPLAFTSLLTFTLLDMPLASALYPATLALVLLQVLPSLAPGRESLDTSEKVKNPFIR